MAQLKTHDHCRYYSYQKCPHINDKIIRQARQYKPRNDGGKPIKISFPYDEEINKICDACDLFSPKKEIP
jgi:hypothetical protein